MQAGIQKIGDTYTRKKIISKHSQFSITRQCQLLNISRSSSYYKVKEGENSLNQEIMKEIDKIFTENSAMGVRQMTDHLKGEGYNVGRKRIRRLMALMGLKAIYPMPSLSKGGWVKYRMPYLLRNLQIKRKNQVWSTAISYIPMENGFMYLYAIIDVYSRYILSWGLFNTLDASNAIEILDSAIARYGNPEIINSDQGIQYTCREWHNACKKHSIKISMNGRARCLDNV